MFLWFCTANLPQDEYGVCIKCMLKYTEYEDELGSLKVMLREVIEGVVPWSVEAENVPVPVQPKDLEDWEDDLFG